MIVAVLLAGCSQEPAAVSESTPEPVLTTTTTVTTTTAPTTTVEVTTTLAPPPTVLLPQPQPPPGENDEEPLLELGSIEIPRLGITKSLFEGVTIATLNHGPGHWPGTALPGMLGNVVIGGHRTAHDRPFRYIDKMKPGDQVIFVTEAGRFVYTVLRTEIVTPDALWIVDQTDAYTATLFACNPVGSTKERIVVFLELAV